MTIEAKIDALTAAVLGLTAAISSGASAGVAAVKADKPAAVKADKPAAAEKKAKSSISKAEMQAAVNEVKENFDTATAKALIKAAGFDKLADVTEDKFQELYDAAKEKIAELGGSGEGGDGL